MSTKDAISLLLQFGLFLVAVLTLVVTLVKHLTDNHTKKK